jgi:hypothetical protein
MMGYGPGPWVVVHGVAVPQVKVTEERAFALTFDNDCTDEPADEAWELGETVVALHRENARLRAERDTLALACIEASIAVYTALGDGKTATAVANVAVKRLTAICKALQADVNTAAPATSDAP